MHEYPHLYQVTASAQTDAAVQLNSPRLGLLESQPPEQFGGPGDYWSPETLLVAAVADCYILTFRAIARASSLEWSDLECDTDGILDRVENVTRFTRFDLRVTLSVPAGTEEHKAMRVLEKAKAVCLITNSLTAEKTLDAKIVFV